MCEVKIARVRHRLNEHPMPVRVITKKFALLTSIKNEDPGLLGVQFMSNGLLNEQKICL